MQIMADYNEYLEQYYVTSSQLSTQATYAHPHYNNEFMYQPDPRLATQYYQALRQFGIDPNAVTSTDEETLKRVVNYILQKLWQIEGAQYSILDQISEMKLKWQLLSVANEKARRLCASARDPERRAACLSTPLRYGTKRAMSIKRSREEITALKQKTMDLPNQEHIKGLYREVFLLPLEIE